MRVLDADIAITFGDQSQVNIAWTGVSGYTSWIYVNGLPWAELTLTGTAKTAQATADTNKPVRVEIHELPSGIEPELPCETPNDDNPWVFWKPVSNAMRYQIYGRNQFEGYTQRLKVVNHDPLVSYYQELITMYMKRDGGCYWWMKVDALSTHGISSAATEWPYFTMGLPPLPTNATVTRVGTGPSATLTLTLQV